MHYPLGAQRGVRKVVLAEDVRIVVVAVDHVGHVVAQPLREVVQADARTRGNRKGEDDAGERGVHARLVQAKPQDETAHHIGAKTEVLRLVEHEENRRHQRGAHEPLDTRRLAVEDGDRGDGDEVVGDGERGKEHADARGNAVAQQREDAEREGDVGRHGDGPTVDRAALVEEGIDARGNDHAAHRGEHGQQRLTRPAQLAHGHLVLEFDAHEQEEDRHKKVVHEQLDRHGDRKAAHAERDGLEQEVMDRLVGVRVGAHHRRERSEHHHRRRDRAVPRDALPQVVAREELALPLGK